jgi:hypothetical protein
MIIFRLIRSEITGGWLRMHSDDSRIHKFLPDTCVTSIILKSELMICMQCIFYSACVGFYGRNGSTIGLCISYL